MSVSVPEGEAPRLPGRCRGGFKAHNGVCEEFGQVWQAGDVIGCGVDVDAGVILYTINGTDFSEVAFSGLSLDSVVRSACVQCAWWHGGVVLACLRVVVGVCVLRVCVWWLVSRAMVGVVCGWMLRVVDGACASHVCDHRDWECPADRPWLT